MIGQKRLQENFKQLAENNKFPRFSILVGPKGSGKKLIADWVSLILKGGNITMMLPDVKVDTIRTMITNAYRISKPTVYIIPDADKMSPAAKNALLKVTEEPPNNAYFIMTLEDIENTLATIKSRGTVFYIDPYEPSEIEKFYMENSGNVNNTRIVQQICDTPGDVLTLQSYDVNMFWEYVDKVVDNIANVSGSNSFKIADKIAFKDGDDGYDLKLFWNAFSQICLTRFAFSESDWAYCNGVIITGKYLSKLKTTGIRKDSLFDLWILDIRKEWA